ncbi:MAG: glycosyl hydrolase 115 family protein [Candidatus Marinimicrobia bacterium]|nr:glycosyl hydrolase 115 family protein [Candidatus Neomarinimicrobiota bacterium]MCF7880616.1 glycosyl hydrolase 115 family protein [Candidatus Neomarinimicrobiota bacterium]
MLLLAICILLVSGTIYSQEMNGTSETAQSYVVFQEADGAFPLVAEGKSASIIMSSTEYAGVVRAGEDLQNDIEKVSGFRPQLSRENAPSAQTAVIIGTIGKSGLIDRLIDEGKLNVTDIRNQWETFLIQTIEKPFPGVNSALVIAGSDKRGTIYGIYDLAKNIGVSPWYYWADVPVKKHAALYVLPGSYKIGPPKVKYRGIFINDEAPALSGWAHEKFGGFNHQFYEKVFELILRLRGNYLWPAMWGNAFNVDDTLNPKLADEYGIVMGTSHHEPMMRAWKEWDRFGEGPWNYQKNDSTLREYWRKGIERMNDYESIVTLGMRGDGDEPMSEDANIALLKRIVSDQREIIREVTGEDITEIPQVWALYKEVQKYYDDGMRVPDDVTLLFADDNWGNVRRLPEADAEPREGGYGMYYHFDYVGGPRNYKWLNTNQIERVWEQMHLTYEHGVKRIWIVNVGDIKPMEFPISFFLDYAWNPEKYDAKDLPVYYRNWATNQFGAKYADDIADILAKYTKYNSRRTPELLSPETYSLVHYREAETVVADYNRLANRANEIYNEMPEEYKAAFYQLVLHPVIACANLNELYITAGLNRLYASQGRALTDSLADRVKALFNQDADITKYYNKELNDGKWSHMMDQTHIGYTYWQQPEQNNMPEIETISLPKPADMGVAIEGSDNWWPRSDKQATLPTIDKYNRNSRYVEIFNRGKSPFEFSIKPGKPWISVSPKTATVKKQQRVRVDVSWDIAPAGLHEVPLTIEGTGKTIEVGTKIVNPREPEREKIEGFVETNGYVSIEAPHRTNSVEKAPVQWTVVPNLGRTLSAVTPFPVTASPQSPEGDNPHLAYRIYFFSEGEVSVKVFTSPTLKYHNEGLRYAVSIDDEEPQVINMNPNPYYADLNYDSLWNVWVANNINIRETNLNIGKSGYHVLKFWMIDPGVVLQKIVIDTGGLKKSYLGPPESFFRRETVR